MKLNRKAISEGSTKEDDAKTISIKYVGNSCFYITFSDGTRLVTDPYVTMYTSKLGTFPEMEADVMTISHTHTDHTDGKKYFTGDPKEIASEDINETITVGDVGITGYTSKHIAQMGDSTIFVYEEDGLKIVHMGETDNIASKEAQDAVKNAGVILAYAGELGDIKNKDSFEALNKLNIKVIIPQHYSMDAENRYFGEPTIEEILLEVPEGTKVTNSKEFIVTKDLEKQFVVMDFMEN